jgi:hypothetical protein
LPHPDTGQLRTVNSLGKLPRKATKSQFLTALTVVANTLRRVHELQMGNGAVAR